MVRSTRSKALSAPARLTASYRFVALRVSACLLALALSEPAWSQNSQLEQLREQIRQMERQGADVTTLKKLLADLEREAERSPDVAAAMNAQAESGYKCLQGTWKRTICGGTSTATVKFILDPDGRNGTGIYSDVDCARVCSRSFSFKFQASNDTSMRVEYTNGEICGERRVPTGGQQAWSCRAGTLQFGQTFTR